MTNVLRAIYSEILRTPKDDGPRLAYADAVATLDPARAEYVSLEVSCVRRRCEALVAQLQDEDNQDCGKASSIEHRHIARWEEEAGVPRKLRMNGSAPGTWMRGFLEWLNINLDAPDRHEMIDCLDRFPILHLAIDGITTDPLPPSIRAHIPRMATLSVKFADDASALAFLERYDLRNVRNLALRGSLSERVLHRLCRTDLPGLEDFDLSSPLTPNPSDQSISFNWESAHTHTVVHPLSIELEKRYGWKKYFHVASRFSVFPYYTPAIFDILPPMPPEPSAWDRTLDGVTLEWDPAYLKPH